MTESPKVDIAVEESESNTDDWESHDIYARFFYALNGFY